jgi:RimJ/RimL family protein N-acetyltransferase
MLKGDRVLLRAVRHDDLKAYWAFRQDVEVVLLADALPPRPRTFEEVEAAWEEHQRNPGDSLWFAIEADGKFIGQCLLHEFDRAAMNCELGITIGDRAYWSKGYGREVVGLLLDYAFRILNQHRVWLTTNAANERAIRSYLACGFQEEGRLREQYWIGGSYDDAVYMGILRAEWHAGPERAGHS